MSLDTAAAIEADFFDGRSARPQPVRLHFANGWLHVEGIHGSRRLTPGDIEWPERTRHGPRIAHLRDGGSLVARDPAAWDAWARAAGIGESWVVRAQQNWRGTLAATLLLIGLAVFAFVWGVPLLARGVLALTPPAADSAIGDAVLRSFDDRLLLPSAVPEARQQAVRQAFAAAVERTRASGGAVLDTPYTLRFHTSPPLGPAKAGAAPARTQLGANAFALPGGTIVVTDEMLALLDGRDEVLLGVLGHELGHVQRRHGMRMLVQAALIGAAASIAWGDFSSLLAAAPVLLGQSAYSRDFEREADADAVTLLRANGLSPALMVELFERLQAARPKDGGTGLGIALASHPADAERIAAFRAAAAGPTSTIGR